MQTQPPDVFCKKVVLRNFAKFTGKYLCQTLYFNKVAQVFFCEFCEISKNTFLAEPVWATASNNAVIYFADKNYDKAE